MQPKIRLFAMTLSVILLSFVSNFSFAQTTATLTSDKEDYAPGSTAIFTGSGFAPGETVTLQVTHVGDDPVGIDPQYHEPWTVMADADGKFVTTWWVPDDGDALGATLKATADGQSSRLHAETFFTDASNVSISKSLDATTTACNGASVQLLASALGPNANALNVIWEFSSNGGASWTTIVNNTNGYSISITSPTPNPGSNQTTSSTLSFSAAGLLNSYIYRVTFNGSGGGNTANTSTTLSVSSPSAPTGTASQTFCNAATVADLTATGSGIQWYSASSGGSPLAGTTALVNGNHYYASQTVSGCESIGRFDVTVTINTPSAPTGTASQTFCNAATVADLTATGSGIQWYSASSGGSPLAGTTALVNGNHYYASQTVSGCESIGRFDVTVTINTPSAPTGTASQTFCNAATVADLTATGSGIQWYSASSGGSPLAGTTALVNGNHYYASQTVSGCESIGRFDVTVTINTPSAPTGTASQTFCNAATVADLTATGSGIQWYSASSGGSPLAGTTALVNGNHYYASQTVSGCESIGRFDVTVTINTPSAPTGTASQTFCNAATVADLTATGSGIQWYSASSGGSPLAGTTALVNGNHYYASQTVSGCESIGRFDVTVTINTPSAPTGTASQTFCNAATVADLTATGSGIQWYSASSGGSPLAGTTALVNGNHYYASQTVSGCESIGRFDVTVTINTPSAPTGTASQTFCNAATVADLTATGSGIQWYSASSGGSPLAGTTALVNGNHYYASQTVSGCESIGRFDVTVTINTPSAPTGTASQTFCNAATVADLTATGSGIQWYSASSGGSPLAGTTALVNGNHYYASQTVSGCESIGRFDVTVTINTPSAPTGTASQTFCNAATVADLTATGSGIQWYSASSGGSPLAGTTALVNGNHYYASQTVSGCESIGRFDVTVTINTPSAPTGTASQTFCNAATVADLTATGSGIQWYSASSGGSPLAGTTALVNGNHYYASQTVSGCESIGRFDVTVTINTPSAPTGTASQTFCNAATVADLTATGSGIQWYSASSGGSPLAGTTALVNGNHYYASQTVSGCESIGRFDVTVTINTPSAPTGTASQTFCNAATVADLTATGSGIQWYSASSGGSPLAGTTALVNGNHYYASQTVSGCESIGRFDVTVTINTPSAPTGTASQTFCAGATVADLVATGTGIKWYSVSSGGVELAASTVLVNGNHYFASQTINGCEGLSRLDVTVTLNALPNNVSGGFIASAICLGQTGVLRYDANNTGFATPHTISYTDGTTTWQQVIASNSETSFNLPVTPSSTTTYSLVSIVDGNGCTRTTGFADGSAELVVRPLPLDKTITAQNSPICSGNGTNIQVASSQNGVNYQLRDNADNSLVGSAVGGNGGTINLPTGNLATTTTFNVLATSTAAGACSVQMTGTVTVTVNPTPSAPTGNATQSFVGPSTVANLQTTSGANIKWYDAATNGNLLLSTAALVTGNHYYASQTVNGCESVTRLDVKVILTEQTITSIDKTVYCSGENMVIEFKTTGTYQSGNEFKAELSNGGGNYPGGNPSFLVEVSPATVFDVQTIDGIVYTFYRMTVKIPIIRNAADHYNIRIDATETEPNGLLLLGNNYAYNNVGFVINPAPDDFTVTGGGAYCSGGSGVAIGLDDSQTGVNYLLYHYTNGGADSSLVTTVAGTGVAISFGLQTTLGTYKVKAVFSNGTGCGIMMSGSATITADSPATVTTSNACAGGSTVTFTQAGGTTGGTWSVSGGGTIDPATGVFTPTTAGCFTATYTTPVANCTDTKSFVVFPAAPSAPVVSNTCNAALTIPALTVVAGFTAQYSFDGGVNWSTSNTSSSATPGCYSMKTRYVLTSACGGTAANAAAPSACEASALGYAVIFPAKPVLNAPSNTCNVAFSLPSVTPVSGFTVQYSINDGGYAVLANVVVPTTPGCYSIKARYVLTSVCGGNAANATAPATCFESDAVNVVIFPSAPVLTAPDNTCNAAFTLPSVTEVSSFTIQYKIDNGSWSAAPTVPTSTGCHTVKARYVLTSACGSITANTIAPASCEESNEVSVVIFPSAPSAPVVNNTCNSALTIPVVTPVSGFTAQYSFDGGTNWSTSNTSSSTTPGCYTMKSRYVLTNACGSTAANATAPTACEASAAGYAVIFPAKPSLSAPANTCASAFTLPTVTAVSGFTVQYSFNGGVYVASADVVVPTTPGCYSIKARYVLTSACGSNATNATAPASCLESDAVNVVIFPSAPVLSAPDNTCNAAFTLPSVTAKTGFTVQYKIDAGSWTASPTVPTTPGCHTIKARYVLTAACGGNAINATAPATCLESNEVSVVIFPAAPTITTPANVCNSMFTLPTVAAKTGFDIQYKIDNGNWEAAPTTTTVGCHTVKARYVLKDACGSNAVGTTGPAACAESNEVNVVIFPAAPPAPTVNSGAGAIVVTPPTSVSGFNIEYSFNDGSTWGTNTPPTADNCDGYKIRTRYVTANACGSIAAGTSISCSTSPYTLRIVDNTLPTITCKADVTTPTDAGLCDATVTLEAPTVSDACGIAANGLTNDHPSNQYPFGTTVVTWTVRDVNGNTNTCQQQVIVNKVTTTTTVTVTPVVPYPTQDGTCPKQQYSQKVSFTATVTPVCTAAGSIVNAASIVTFKIGTQTMGTAPVDATGTATLSNVNLTETVSGQLAAGTRTVAAVYSGYSNYLTSTGTTCLEIVKEDLCATYNGYMQVAAASTSKNSCKANFTMSVGVSDLDGYGDVSKVKVYFYVNGSTTPYIVDVVPINDTKTQGNASKNIDFSFNGTYTTIDIEYDIVSDYYQRSTEVGCDADGDVPINFYLPQNEFITGGGYVKPTQSAGKLSAESGRKANFGFNVKYTKSGTNLQGNINYIFRRLEDDNIIHVYQVKGNAMSTLTVNANANPRTAVFNGKCNVADVTENPNPLVPLKDYLTPLGGTGNSTMQVLVSDGGEPGISVDQYGITVWNSRGELFHSSNWISTQTVKQLLSGGNIQVSGATSTPYSITTIVRDDQNATSFLQSNVHEFSIAAYPNPTSNQFKVQLQSSDKVQKIQLRVTDITGRLIQVFNNLAAGQVMEIGSTYRPGIYILQMIQGNQHKQLKLLKIPD